MQSPVQEVLGTPVQEVLGTSLDEDHWRSKCLGPMLSECRSNPMQCRATGRDIYEFGVFSGTSMKRISEGMRAANATFTHFWGFDSFEGLPAEKETRDIADYAEGRYSSQGFFGVSGNALLNKLEKSIGDSRVRWVRGFYNETCTPHTSHMLPFSPALFVDLDCDLYTSTFQALDWMFSSGLIVSGTIIGYDDWIHGGPNGQQGAHANIIEKHKAQLLVRGPVGSHPAFHPLPHQNGDDLRCWMVA